MKQLLEVIASALVDNPDEVVVTETEDENEIVLSLKVAPGKSDREAGQDRQGDPYRCARLCLKERQKNTGGHPINDGRKWKESVVTMRRFFET